MTELEIILALQRLSPVSRKALEKVLTFLTSDSMMDEYCLDRGITIAAAAFNLFIDAGYVQDFCIRTANVFGGSNRVLWSPTFRCDETHCTPEFITAINEVLNGS